MTRKLFPLFVMDLLGLLQATDKNGDSILKNKRVTGFTNGEEETVKLDKTVPFSLED